MWSTAQVRNTRKQLKTIRGCKNTQDVLLYLCQRSPFTPETSSIWNIATGVTAPPSVILHESKSIIGIKHYFGLHRGTLICLTNISDEGPSGHHGVKAANKIKDKHVHVHPQLLFQTLMTVGMKNGGLQKNFVTSTLNTTKFILKVATWCSEAPNFPGPSETVQYVLDGGAFLHSRIPWRNISSDPWAAKCICHEEVWQSIFCVWCV